MSSTLNTMLSQELKAPVCFTCDTQDIPMDAYMVPEIMFFGFNPLLTSVFSAVDQNRQNLYVTKQEFQDFLSRYKDKIWYGDNNYFLVFDEDQQVLTCKGVTRTQGVPEDTFVPRDVDQYTPLSTLSKNFLIVFKPRKAGV